MDFDFADFLMGLTDGLKKTANEGSIFDQGGAIFPNITSQAKWQFARTGSHLQLHDGNHVYNFHLPEGEKEYDFPAVKEDHPGLHEFGKDAHNTGTAQIHRADPGSIYFTLQDGRNNPTYTLKHVNASQWRAIPKQRANGHQIDKEAFMKGVHDKLAEGGLLDVLTKGVDGLGRGAVRSGMALGHDPLLSAGAGALAGGLYDIGKRTFYNSEEENKEETGMDRLKRYLLPAIAAGGIGATTKTLFPNYYSQFPEFRP